MKQRSQIKPSKAALEKMLGEVSWLLSHAQALADYGRNDEAEAELAKAASFEEQVAYWLDAAGQEREAVVHRVSAASCYEQLRQYARAVTLLRAALSSPLSDDYRNKLEQQLARGLANAKKGLHRASPRVTRKLAAVAG